MFVILRFNRGIHIEVLRTGPGAIALSRLEAAPTNDETKDQTANSNYKEIYSLN